MTRLATLNDQFAIAKNKLTKALDEEFVNSWSYLSMDEHLSEKGLRMRDQVVAFTNEFKVSKDNSISGPIDLTL